MQKYADVVLDRKGNVVPGASVRVKTSTGTDAVLYSANGSGPISNPITTDNLGRFAFYAANGRYNLQVYIGSALFTVSNDILLEDPMDETPEVIKGGTIKDVELTNVTIDGKAPAYKEVTDDHEERIESLEGAGSVPSRLDALEEFDADLANQTDPSKGSGMVGHRNRSVADRLDQVVYVKDFLAEGDGAANDFTAIRSAILAANGKRLVFDKATAYRIDGAGSLMVFGPDDLPDGVTIDFNGQSINWAGTRLTDGSQGDKFATNWGVFTFRGTEGASYSATIGSALVAPISFLPEPASHGMVVGDCILVQTLAPGIVEASAEFKDRIINRAARLVRISGGNLYFDGRFEWDIPAGTTLKYTKLNTLKNINITGMKFNDISPYDTVNKDNGASCIVFEACEDCCAIVNDNGTPEHVVSILRSRAVVASGYANNPKETVQGGYFTQITQSSHVYIREARGREERHIVDVTASAYVTVERSGSLATANATFTTHGAYEHDLRYRDCYGYMSYSNSGATFGGSTRLVDVENHTGANLNFGQNAYQGLSDATFRNCHFASESYISLDGVHFIDCTFSTVRLAQNSSRSKRKNIFENCPMTLHPEAFKADSTAVASPVTTAAVKFKDSFINFVTTPTMTGGDVTLDGGEMSLSGAPVIAIPLSLINKARLTNRSTSGGVAALIQGSLLVSDSTLSGQALNFTGTGNQQVQLLNATVEFPTGTVTGTALESTKTGGKLKLSVIGGSIDRNNAAARLITGFTAGAELQLRFVGVRLANGDIRLENSLFTNGNNALIYEGVVEEAVTKTAFPAPDSRVGIGQLANTALGSVTSRDYTPWAFAHLLTYKPGIDPAGWDWSPAINATLAKYGEVSLGMGAYGVLSPLVIKPGNRIKGKGPGHAGGTAYTNIFASRIIALSGFVGDAVITGSITAPENVLTAPQLEQFRLDLSQCGSHGIHLSAAYDGAKLDNVHVVGAAEDKHAIWFDGGSYGLAQTLLGTNCHFMRRANSTSTLPVALFEALNESNLIGCKFFGSMGGVLASAGAAAEFKGCSGMTMLGCSTAFSADGVAITDHPTRKTIGFSLISPTFEAHTGTALTIRGSATRKATEVHLVAPRYYDSVFTMVNSIDVDYVEQSDFDCQFKHAITGGGADQNIIHIQRQNQVTDGGTNTLILSRPNAIETNYGISKRIGALGGITASDTILADGGLGLKVSIFTAASGAVNKVDRLILVNRATVGTYTLPSAAAFGSGRTQILTVRGIGAGSITLNAAGADLIEGIASLNIATGGKATLASDGVSGWYLI